MPVSNESYKILFQAIDTIETLLYTSPTTGLGTIVSNLAACNTSAVGDTISIEIVPFGGTDGVTAQMVMSGTPIPANTTTTFPGSITLAPGDMIYGWAGTNLTAISGFGCELS